MVSSGQKPMLACKGLRVGDFNGKTLSTISGTTLKVNPTDVPEVQQLRNW